MKRIGKKTCERLGIDYREFKSAVAANHRDIDGIMEICNKLMGGYGVESISDPTRRWRNFYADITYLYVNMGDSYAQTLWFDTDSESFLIGDTEFALARKGL